MPTDACEFDHPHDAHPCGKRIKRIKWSEVLVKKRSKDPDNWDAGVKAALDELTRMAEDDTLEEPMTEDAHKVEPVELDSLIGVPGPLMTPPRPSDHIERLEALGGLADQLGATLFEAMEFLVARDEMNAKIHMADPRWSPLTVLCREGVERWRNWKIDDGVEDSPIVEAAPYVGCSDEDVRIGG